MDNINKINEKNKEKYISVLDMINEKCPNGVEFRELEKVVEIKRGKRLTRKQLIKDGKYEVYHGSKDTPLGNYNEFNVNKDTVIIVNTGGIGGVKYCDQPVWCSDGSFWLKTNNKIYNKYLYYYLSQFEEYFIQKKRVGGVPTIDRKCIEEINIPLPPLEIQTEIIKILDQFEELEKELEKELKMRIDQYEYYRNKLLSFDDSVEVKKLGEVCNFQNGYAFKSNLFVKKGNPIVRITNIDGHNILMDDVKYFNFNDYKTDLSSFIVNKNDILIALSGATTGKVGQYKSDKPIYINQRVGKFLPNKNQLDNQYLFHVLLMNKEKLFELASGAGAQPNLSSTKLMNELEIPVPSLEVQKSIAETLDQFDELCTSLTNGIPAEISMRKEQYEYYRNLLLNFKNINEDDELIPPPLSVEFYENLKTQNRSIKQNSSEKENEIISFNFSEDVLKGKKQIKVELPPK